MALYPGVYRAQCVGVSGGEILAYVPQVFGDVRINFTGRTGDLPKPNTNGWVMFESGRAALPVWVSATTVGGGTAVEAAAPQPVMYYFEGVGEAGTPFVLGGGTFSIPANVPVKTDLWIDVEATGLMTDLTVFTNTVGEPDVVVGIDWASGVLDPDLGAGASFYQAYATGVDLFTGPVTSMPVTVTATGGGTITAKFVFMYTPVTWGNPSS